MLDQLAILAGGDDTIASAGPPPDYRGFDLPVTAVHCPMGCGRLGGLRMGDLARPARIVHAWSPKAAFAARAIAWRYGKPALLSWPSLPTRRDLRWLCRQVRTWPVQLTVPTEVAHTAMVWAGLDASAVHIMNVPVRPAAPGQLASARKRVRDALGVGDDQFLLVAPAEMTACAGHKYASWAHAIVRQIIDNVLLLMPSDGPNRERVRFFAATTGYNDEVFFPEDYPEPFTEGLSRREALAAADVALFLAERDTGLAAVLDAMACGVAIAAANTPDVAECAPDEQAALLCPVCDPRAASANVLRLIEDRSLAAGLSTEARIRSADCFGDDDAKKRLEAIYAAVAEE